MIYCQAKVTRSGIGNRLIPWARSQLYAHQHQLPVLAPIWPFFPKGFFIRGRKWKYYYSTFYHKDFCFENESIKIGFWASFALRFFTRKFPSPASLSEPPPVDNRKGILVFSRPKPPYWPQLCFAEFKGKREFLGEKIRRVTSASILRTVDSYTNIPIGIHLRTEMNIGGDLSWFVNSLSRIRKELGYEVPAFLGTDAETRELFPLLQLGNITLLKGPAISDLLILSKARLFLASGHSSFSAWISFLGQMPSICNPTKKEDGQYPWQRLGVFNEKGQFLGPFDPQHPSKEVIQSFKTALA